MRFRIFPLVAALAAPHGTAAIGTPVQGSHVTQCAGFAGQGLDATLDVESVVDGIPHIQLTLVATEECAAVWTFELVRSPDIFVVNPDPQPPITELSAGQHSWTYVLPQVEPGFYVLRARAASIDQNGNELTATAELFIEVTEDLEFLMIDSTDWYNVAGPVTITGE